MKLKYKVLPAGAFDGQLPVNLVYVDAKDVHAAGVGYLEACRAIAKDYDEPAAIDILDMDAMTVTSDGICAPGAVVAFAAIDHHMLNEEFGYIPVSEFPYDREIIAQEPHMKQWDALYPGRRLYRGPSVKDRGAHEGHNENQANTGRISNNNTGSEMFDLITMEEVITPFFGMMQIMHNDKVLVGKSGPEISVGIGMIVREYQGRIFGFTYGAGMTAHRSGEYAKTVKSFMTAIVAPKPIHAEFVLRALEIGMVPGRDIASSPVNLCLAHATGHEIDLDNITKDAWIELESIGLPRAKFEAKPEKIYTHEEAVANADQILPGVVNGKIYESADYLEERWAEI